jgi:hypothetical protein
VVIFAAIVAVILFRSSRSWVHYSGDNR